MKRSELKPILADFFKKMMGEWFEDLPLLKGLGISLIEANINKYDTIFELFEDEKGNIDTDSLIENIELDTVKIDLKQISPILPNRILLITKDDIDRLKKKLRERY